ncbi:TIGR02594 family protein [Sphingomonas lacusdianchii]|uniref:TIGR02594 family protein n=1 Tax=Sphingomonas lacusdianchii TaxID=2917992 RepID=UPI001F573DEB|nr:TIGR02594 family protein [Sphingomonas sp. JXJ CY 53]
MTTADPAWLKAARAKLGTREAPGPANNPTIMGWAKRLGTKALGIAYNADSVPWCGVFVAACMQEAGLPTAPIAVRASAWANYGQPLAFHGFAPGAILVFQRPGGGHVGFYVGEDDTAYHVLGGNQSDNVTVARIERARCVAARWPTGIAFAGGPVRMASRAGVPLSRNEA